MKTLILTAVLVSLAMEHLPAVPLPATVGDDSAPPFANTGLLLRGPNQGTASVFFEPRLLLTAGHLFLSPTGQIDASDAEFLLRNQTTSQPPRGSGVAIARVFLYRGGEGYGAAVGAFGEDSVQAFQLDVAICHAYTALNEGRFATAVMDPAAALAGGSTKTILGYCPSLYGYPVTHPEAYTLHQSGPGSQGFVRYAGSNQFYTVDAPSAEATPFNVTNGYSGGPVMVQNTVGLWQTAAILVGSSADAVISPSLNAGRAYVRVLDPAFVDAMVRPAMATLAPTGSPTIPGFGKVTQVITTTYFHNQLGWLTFPNGAPAGYFTPYAWSISLASWIATDGQNLWNSDYGRIEPSESPMLIRTSALGDTYLGNFGRWVYSTRCGWVHSMKTGRPDYFWSNTLGLLYADNLGGIYSFALSRWI